MWDIRPENNDGVCLPAVFNVPVSKQQLGSALFPTVSNVTCRLSAGLQMPSGLHRADLHYFIISFLKLVSSDHLAATSMLRARDISCELNLI